MRVVELPDELHRLIDRQVAEGRATSPAALVEEAIGRLIDAERAEEDELLQLAAAGSADIEHGRYTTIATEDDSERLQARMMDRLRGRPTTGD